MILSPKTHQWSEEPVFSLTSDVDWASDYCLTDLFSTAKDFGIVPTVFSTHRSSVLDEFHDRKDIEVGVHPNFLPGSSHGNDVNSVIGHVFNLVPNAICFRSHCFVDSTEITSLMGTMGVKFDSNICLYFQPNLSPLHHWSGILRFPVFWEDDVHWHRSSSWRFEEYRHFFFTPGLKVLNIHPFFFALNIPNAEFYSKVKPHIPTLTEEQAKMIQNRGDGCRTFVMKLLDSVFTSGYKFVSLSEIYDSYGSQVSHES